MGTFSRFNCFRGYKTRRPEPVEPACQVPVKTSDEKTISLPRNVSNQRETVDVKHAEVAGAEPEPVPQEAVLVRTPEPNHVAESSVESPPPPPSEVTPAKDLSTEVKAEEPPLNSSGNLVSTAPSTQTAPQPGRAASSTSSHSKSSSQGSSLKKISTQTTTPPQTPVETEAKSAPCAPTLFAEKEKENENAGLKTDDVSPAAEAGREHTDCAPSSRTEAADTKALEASPLATAPQPTPIPTAADKPNLDLNTEPSVLDSTLSNRRPSYEDDTPTTPLGQQHPPTSTTNTAAAAVAARPPVSRASTAPASSSITSRDTNPTPNKEKRRSRLSRFLSTREAKDVQATASLNIGGNGTNIKKGVSLLELVEEERKREKEEPGNNKDWEKQVQQQQMCRVEGRKWREEDDNASLFCY